MAGEKPRVLLVDVDGTLAMYNDYNSPPIPFMIAIVNEVSRGIPIVVITGRYEKDRAATEEWLHKHGLDPVEVFMRPDNDHSSNAQYKAATYAKYIQPKYDVIALIDNNMSTISAMASLGVPALAVIDPCATPGVL